MQNLGRFGRTTHCRALRCASPISPTSKVFNIHSHPTFPAVILIPSRRSTDPYSVVLRRKKLPMGLLQEPDKVSYNAVVACAVFVRLELCWVFFWGVPAAEEGRWGWH